MRVGLAIEPFMWVLSCERGLPTVLGCADDINIFVISQGDVQCQEETLRQHEKASSAQVNWAKSDALLLGQWNEQAVHSRAGRLQQRKE